jgi:hypothetical protein
MSLKDDVEASEKMIAEVHREFRCEPCLACSPVSQKQQDSEHVHAIEITFDPIATRKLVLKQDLRIMQLTAAIYLLCFLDRSNIGKFYSLAHINLTDC